MAPFFRTEASLRIMGKDLDPDAITQALGVQPDYAVRDGQVLLSEKPRKHVPKTNIWLLKDDNPEFSLAGKIDYLLHNITIPKEAWLELTKPYDVDMFCGIFVESGNEGGNIPPDLMAHLAELDIALDLDVYAVDQKIHSNR